MRKNKNEDLGLVLRRGVFKKALAISILIICGLIAVGSLFRGLKTEREAKSATSALAEETQVPELGDQAPESPVSDGMRSSLTGTPPSSIPDLSAIDKNDPTQLQSMQALKQIEARLGEMDQCLASTTCNYPNDAPAAYDTAVQLAMAREILELSLVVKNNDVNVDAQSKFAIQSQALARRYLKSGNDDVKEACIELLSYFPVSDENLLSVVSALRLSASGPLYRHGLSELSRYVSHNGSQNGTTGAIVSGDARLQLDAFLTETLEHGGVAASREVARSALAFMREDNLPVFASLLRELPERSPSHQLLKLNLQEFVRQSRGG